MECVALSDNREYILRRIAISYEDGTTCSTLQRNAVLWDDSAGVKTFDGINTSLLYVERRWILKICSLYACQPQSGARITQPVSQVLAMSFSVVDNWHGKEYEWSVIILILSLIDSQNRWDLPAVEGTPCVPLPRQNSSEMNVSDLIINPSKSQLTTPINKKVGTFWIYTIFFSKILTKYLILPTT